MQDKTLHAKEEYDGIRHPVSYANMRCSASHDVTANHASNVLQHLLDDESTARSMWAKVQTANGCLWSGQALG